MNFEIIRIAVALLGTGAAAYQDAKTSFIDDKLTISMIALGTLLNILVFDWDFAIYSIGITAIIFAIGYVLHRTGQLGGGDVLLFCGIQALLPYYPVDTMAQVFSAVGAAGPG
ncbi:MAG: A24 family peptidase, partial [Candidatus Micrarchaeia archaeon]